MKLYQRLEKWAYWLRFRATYHEMKYYLKEVMKCKRDSYFKEITRCDRAIGKTCSLVELSVKYNIPIVVQTYAWKNEIDINTVLFLPRHLRKRKPIVLVANETLYGYHSDILLVDECLSNEQMELVKKASNHIVGYINVF